MGNKDKNQDIKISDAVQFEEYESFDEAEYEPVSEDDLVFMDVEEENLPQEKLPKETKKRPSAGKNKKKKKSHIGTVQVVLGVVMVLAILFAIIKVLHWQKGKDLVVRPEDLTEDFSTENMDYVEYFDPTVLSTYSYDGTWDILILGDCMMYGEDQENGIAGQLQKLTGANVTALSQPTGAISLKNAAYTLDYSRDAFSLFSLVYAMTILEQPNYSMQEEALLYMSDSAPYRAYLDALYTLDMQKIDTIVISCGMYDYLESHPTISGGYRDDNPYGDANGMDGALYSVITLLRYRYPDKQIVVSSPTFCMIQESDGSYKGADIHLSVDGSLADYVGGMGVVTAATNSCFADNYFGAGFTCENYEGYLSEDGTRLSALGAEMVAKHLLKFLYRPQ